MERSKSVLKIAERGPELKNSFVFSVGTDSAIDLAVVPDRQQKTDGASLRMLSLLVLALQRQGFNVVEPKFNKTGQACSSVSIPNGKMSFILAVIRKEDRVQFLLATWERLSSNRYFPSPTSTPDSEKLRQTIEHILADEIGVESLQRLTEREADAVWV